MSKLLKLLLTTGALLGVTSICHGSGQVPEMNAPGYAGPGEKADSVHRPCAGKGEGMGQQEAPLGTELPAEELERLKQEQEKRQLPPAGEYEDKSGQ